MAQGTKSLDELWDAPASTKSLDDLWDEAPSPTVGERALALGPIVGRGIGGGGINALEALAQSLSQVFAQVASPTAYDPDAPLSELGVDRQSGLADNPLAGPIHEGADAARRGLEFVNPMPESVLNEPEGWKRTVFTEFPG